MFKGFYNLNENELSQVWKSNKTLFVFDANVLLNLYGYAEQTRNDFFKTIEILDERIWIPYQVGLEYQRRRLDVIKNEKSVFTDIENNLNKIQKVFKGDFDNLALKRRFPKLSESTIKLEKDIDKCIVNYKKSVAHWNKAQPCVRSHDSIREKINSCFENKVGNEPSGQTWLDGIYQEGKIRYENKVPPGFKDGNKGNKPEDSFFVYNSLSYEKQYGDLILWKQLIEKAKDKDIDCVIFVTDDGK
ncbi:PIN-like domain-containing protein, partial [Vibrio alginolyticus]|uniref:PIN-like domain-containing protein n=1 Tax=Vibrio alginolyticus TaxID=663 RepID=UPI0035507E05